MKKLMLIAGEVSGDKHAGKLAKELKSVAPEVEIFGVGGDNMAEAGVEIIYRISEIALVGFIDVFKKFGLMREVMRLCQLELKRRKPDAVVLVDYPGFNLRFAEFAKENNVKVFYYIAPQVWAWGESRVKKLKNFVDKLFVVFKFEEDFFKRYGVNVRFVGHPLLEDVLSIETVSKENFLKTYEISAEKIVSILPGSRAMEVKHMLYDMLVAGKKLQSKYNVQIAIGYVKNVPLDVYVDVLESIRDDLDVKFVDNSLLLLKFSHMAIVKSGTATLESAILGTPMVICYKTNFLNYIIGKMLISSHISNIGLANIIAGRQIVPELIQNRCTPDAIFNEARKILEDEKRYRKIKENLAEVRNKLGSPGASRKVAEEILSCI